MIHGALRDGRRRVVTAQSTRFAFICSRPTAWPSRAFTAAAAQGAAAINHPQVQSTLAYETPNAGKAASKATRIQNCTRLLESHLPPHLRSQSVDSESSNDEPFVPNARATANFVLDSDQLYHHGFIVWLAVAQGRWKAAVWIVKLLVEHHHAESPLSNRLSHIIQDWNRSGTIDDLLETPLYLVPTDPLFTDISHIKTSSAASLDELTNDQPENLSRSEIRRHEVLGSIWRGIGRLIIACATDSNISKGEVKPEILEMIALLHHYELMPSSIYSNVPAESEDAIQQPPTLHLLSSRIFTALSDATWRAREMTAMEEARKRGADPGGLEAAGASYRVRVSGVKPEIWLELMLWSCLHGGWILEGTSLLRDLCSFKAQEQWTPISWRDSLSAIMPFAQKDLLDWDRIKYMFDTRLSSTMDGVDITGLRVSKTVSSEVVSAFIDALLNMVSQGVGNRGISSALATRYIHELRRFLRKANLSLGGGSWDAMLLRLLESGSVDVDSNPHVVRRLVKLSPRIGEELQARHSQVLPAYVLDGSAAMLGLLHRALCVEVKNGNLEGALKVFQFLQDRVDTDRYISMSDFFSHKHSSPPRNTTPAGLFTDNFSGIDYPSFSTQIPTATLAAFLELVVDSKSFALGAWMLGIDSTDIDGPLIPESLYGNPKIAAAVVRYATAVNDTALLTKITKLGSVQAEGRGPTIPRELLQAFFSAQVELKRWDSAERILQYMRDTDGFDWSAENAAVVAKNMLLMHPRNIRETTERYDLDRAQAIFAGMLGGQYGESTLSDRDSIARMNTLCIVLSTISPRLAVEMATLRKLPKFFFFTLSVPAYNTILEGVVAAHGSQAGRELVEKFTPLGRQATKQVQKGVNRKPQFLRDAVAANTLKRTSITLAGGRRTIAMYGRLELTPSTVDIIVKQALAERNEARGRTYLPGENEASLDILAWAAATLKLYNFRDSRASLWAELGADGALSEEEMGLVRKMAGAKLRLLVSGRREGDEVVENELEEHRELDAFDSVEKVEARNDATQDLEKEHQEPDTSDRAEEVASDKVAARDLHEEKA